MRLLSLAMLSLIAAPAAAEPGKAAKPPAAAKCQRTASQYARDGSIYRGNPVAPRKLTELPPAIGYMAVYRTIDGCETPMTMVEYRTVRRR